MCEPPLWTTEGHRGGNILEWVGASSDLETATKIARLMVTKFGMTETVRENDMHGELACYKRVYTILRLF